MFTNYNVYGAKCDRCGNEFMIPTSATISPGVDVFETREECEEVIQKHGWTVVRVPDETTRMFCVECRGEKGKWR